MRTCVLCALPMVAVAVVVLLGRKRWIGTGVSIGALVVCAEMASGRLVVQEHDILLGRELVLNSSTRWILLWIYLAAALLCLWAELGGMAHDFGPAALTSVALLSASLLVQPLWMSLLLLPCGMALTTAVARPRTAVAASGASAWLIWIALPIPFLVGAYALLDQLVLHPDRTWVVYLAGLLSLAAAVLWLGLFPFQLATWAWASDGVPLGPALSWMVRDTVVLYMLYVLWQQRPELGTTTALTLLGWVGLFGAFASGLLAVVQHSAGSLLACGMTGTLGTAVAGLATGSADGWQGALALLTLRWVAALVAVAALTVIHVQPQATQENHRGIRESWPRWVGIIGFAAAILWLAGALPGAGFWGRRQVYVAMGNEFQTVWPLWAVSSLGLVVGLARMVPSLAVAKPEHCRQVRGVLALLLLIMLLPAAAYAAARPLQWLQRIPVAFHDVPFRLTR